MTGQAASTSQMGRFETEVLAREVNVTALADLSGQWINTFSARRPTNVVVLDMASSVSPTHGEQDLRPPDVLLRGVTILGYPFETLSVRGREVDDYTTAHPR